MGKNTTVNLRSLVIYHREKGKSLSDIGELLKLPKSTVQSICDRYYKEDRLDNKSSSKGPRKITPSDVKFILREIKRDPKLNAVEINKKLMEFSGKVVNPITIRRVLKKHGFFSRIARRKPLISEINRRKRLDFALKYRNEGLDYWKKVLFVDESKFCVFGSDKRQQKVWRKSNEAYKTKNLCCTVKHGGDSVMIWGIMGYEGAGNLKFIDGIMNKEVYLNVLKENVIDSAEKLNVKENFHFYQDNDPKHKAYVVRLWLLYNCPKVLETPPQSPDLNPIEHLWEHIDRKVRQEHKVRTKADLKKAIAQEWATISPEITKKLVESMPNRLEAVIRNRGGPTKY